MNNRISDLVIKIFLIVGLLLLVLLFPISIFVSFFVSDIVFKVFITIDIVLFIMNGILLISLIAIFGIKQKTTKAEMFSLSSNDYDSLQTFLDNSLLTTRYIKKSTIPLSDDGIVVIYTRHRLFWNMDCFAIVRVKHLSDSSLYEVNDLIRQVLNDVNTGKILKDAVNMIVLVCVDLITPTFQKFVNQNIQQSVKNRFLPTGISFSGKNIYIARQNDGIAITQYKKMRKEFLKILMLNQSGDGSIINS